MDFRVKLLSIEVKRSRVDANIVFLSSTHTGIQMKKYVVLIILAVLTLTCATLEGLVELSPQFIQLNGLLTILFTGAFISWTLTVQAAEISKDG